MKYERQKELMEIVQNQGYVNAAAAAEAFNVSIATIRRDLSQLEHQGLLEKNTAERSFRPVRPSISFLLLCARATRAVAKRPLQRQHSNIFPTAALSRWMPVRRSLSSRSC